MIEIKNLSKSFNNKLVLDDINIIIPDNTILGLVGINGAGKSTLLRIMAGIYKADNGSVLYDDMKLSEYEGYKQELFMLSDNPQFAANAKISTIVDFYKLVYKKFNVEEFNEYAKLFMLDYNKHIMAMSKGQRRRLFISIAFACNTKYVLIDEAFDGLDPLARLEFKEVLVSILENKKLTLVISSHSLHDLEDIADRFILLDHSKILDEGAINESLDKYVKLNLAFAYDITPDTFKQFDPLSLEIVGHTATIILNKDNYKNIDCLKPIMQEEITIDFRSYFVALARREMK